jgi:hypothetical protein
MFKFCESLTTWILSSHGLNKSDNISIKEFGIDPNGKLYI